MSSVASAAKVVLRIIMVMIVEDEDLVQDVHVALKYSRRSRKIR